MSDEILILSQPRDAHAYAVEEALRQKGGRSILWHTTDFPSKAGETLHFHGLKERLRLTGPDLDLTDPKCATVWNRRPAYAITPGLLHPADQPFAEVECNTFRRSLLSILFKDSFWVNPPDAAVAASRKLVQHKVAIEVGLQMPETLYTNDPDEIRQFIRAHGQRAVYKPFRGLT